MAATGTSSTPDGYSMQETGQIPYNPYNEQYGMSSPYADFMMAGYNPDDNGWQTSYDESGMDAFAGSELDGDTSQLDIIGWYELGAPKESM